MSEVKENGSKERGGRPAAGAVKVAEERERGRA